jgi:pyruvate/2-oxoglutarate dehydrogenase complex dihydrolipoamide acyltransferase (E2) component
MDVTYGADYSAGELSPAELDDFSTYDLRFLFRYIGWPDNPKCISHYPGAYHTLTDSGRTVLLVVEEGETDPAGGHDAGVAMAQRARDDAASVGYPDSLPIFFCADSWLSIVGIPMDTAMAYLDGASSVLGKHRVGAYGFRDFIQAAKAGEHAEWLWLCGAAPADGELAEGWPHLYQWNGGHIYPGGVEADLNWAYPGVLEALQANEPAPTQFPVQPGEPAPSGPAAPSESAPAEPAAPSGSAGADRPATPQSPVPTTTPEAAAAEAKQHAGEAKQHAGEAKQHAGEAKQHAGEAANSAADSKKQADTAQAALAGVQAAAQAEPGWIYGMVIGFLGVALLALVAAMVIASLRGTRVISTDVASATTLILGGLIGILAPTPSRKRQQ